MSPARRFVPTHRSWLAAVLLVLTPSATVAGTGSSVALVVPSAPANHTFEFEGERERGPDRRTPEQLDSLALAVHAAESLAGPSIQSNPWPPLFWQPPPGPIDNDYWSGSAPTAGRVTSIAFNQGDPSQVYIAGAQGGVWRSDNGGSSWVTMSEGLTSLASGALAVDLFNFSVVYYGTGEQNYSGDSFYGDGLFRSTNAGLSWSRIATASVAGSYIARVAVDPADSNRIFVASDRGVVRSTNRGTSWSTVLFAPFGRWCNDLVVDYVNLGTVYASIYGVGIYKSTNGGTNWTLLTGGLPTSGFSRINLTIGFNFPPRLYASFVNASTGGLYGMYRSDNGGTSWTPLASTPNYMGSIGWYASAVTCLRSNPDIVVAGGVFPYSPGNYGVVQSTDGGATWTDITFGASTQVHPDVHFVAFDYFNSTLWVACDGGVWKRGLSDLDWTNCNQGLSLQQFYSVDHSWLDYYVVGGTQDLGSVAFEHTPGSSYRQFVSGDGGAVAFAPNSPYFLSSYIYLNPVYKWSQQPIPTPPTYRGMAASPWTAAGDRLDFTLSPLIADASEMTYLTQPFWYAGTHRVWRSRDDGASWTPISGDLTGGTGILRCIREEGVSPPPLSSRIPLWTTSSDGRVFVRFDSTTWEEQSSGLPAGVSLPKIAAYSQLTFVIADRASGDRVFWAYSSHTMFWTSMTGNLPPGRRPLSMVLDQRNGYFKFYLGTDRGLYLSLDFGANWTKLSGVPGSLPDVAIYDLTLQTGFDGPSNESTLIAATHGRGLWVAHPDVVGPDITITSPVGGEQWYRRSTHDVTWTASDPSGVDSLVLYLRNPSTLVQTVIASGIPNTGTYSWTLPETTLADCQVIVAAADGWGNSSAKYSGHFAIIAPVDVPGSAPVSFALEPVRPNPGRAPIAFQFQMPRAATASLAIYDLGGRRVRSLAMGRHAAGVHGAAWDGASDAGTPLGPGIFFARLEAGGFRATRRFALLR